MYVETRLYHVSTENRTVADPEIHVWCFKEYGRELAINVLYYLAIERRKRAKW